MVKTKSKKFNQKTKWEVVVTGESTDSAENLFKVDVKQWKKWDNLGRRMFNKIYSVMGLNCGLFLHPKVPLKTFCSETRNTTCFNAAWMAANSVGEIIDEILMKK